MKIEPCFFILFLLTRWILSANLPLVVFYEWWEYLISCIHSHPFSAKLSPLLTKLQIFFIVLQDEIGDKIKRERERKREQRNFLPQDTQRGVSWFRKSQLTERRPTVRLINSSVNSFCLQQANINNCTCPQPCTHMCTQKTHLPLSGPPGPVCTVLLVKGLIV